jgi:hypothetical protein
VRSDYERALAHNYCIEPGGPNVPGVTTAIGIIDKPGLKWSAAKIVAEYMMENDWSGSTIGTRDEFVKHCTAEFDRQWREKAATGTRVHDVAERWTNGESVDVSLADQGFVDALESFHKQYKPRFLMAERVVLNKTLRFGGRFDFIAELEGIGTVLGDYKSGSKRPLEAALQACAYLHGELATYDEKGSLSGLQPLPKLDGARTIYLRGDGTFEVSQPFEIISEDEAWEGFQACLNLYRIHKQLTKQLTESEKENAKH